MSRFAQLPQSLQILFCAFGAMPLAFAGLCTVHAAEWSSMPTYFLAYTVATYAIGPAVMAAMILLRNHFFLWAYAVQAVLFFSAVFVVSDGLPPFMHSLHMATVVAVVATALMLVNKDILFPFVFKTARGFRREPRLAINRRVTVRSASLGRSFDFMVEDASLTGLSLYADESGVSALIKTLKKGEVLIVASEVGRGDYEVPAEYLWRSVATSIHKIGLRATEPESMRQFYENLLPESRASGIRSKISRITRLGYVRRTFNYALAASLIVYLSLPALTPSVRGRLLEAKEWLVAFGFSEARTFESGKTYKGKLPPGVNTKRAH